MDGGGTKTEICVKNIASGILESFFFGSTNYKNIGIEKTTDIILDAIKTIYKKLRIDGSSIKGMVAGISGCDNEIDFKVYETIINQTDLKRKVKICNDSELAFLAMEAQNGVCSICGTGSIVIGFKDGKMNSRCGGWGSPLSDEGSGWWIGSRVLIDLIRWCDHNAEEQQVFGKLLKFYNIEKSNAPYILAQLEKMKIASCAELILTEAARGDNYCYEVIRKAATLVGGMINSVLSQMDYSKKCTLKIVLAGSIYKNELFTKVVKDTIDRTYVDYLFNNESPAKNGISYAEKIFIN